MKRLERLELTCTLITAGTIGTSGTEFNLLPRATSHSPSAPFLPSAIGKTIRGMPGICRLPMSGHGFSKSAIGLVG